MKLQLPFIFTKIILSMLINELFCKFDLGDIKNAKAINVVKLIIENITCLLVKEIRF